MKADVATMRLGAHHYTATGLAPVDFIHAAADSGCVAVSLFVHEPVSSLPNAPKRVFPYVNDANLQSVVAALEERALNVRNIDAFSIFDDTDIREFEGALKRGRAIKATRAVVTLRGKGERSRDLLRDFCDLANEYGIGASLEFMRLTPGCPDLPTAVEIVHRTDRQNLGVGLDAIHLFRSGATVTDVSLLPKNFFTHLQMDDHVYPRVADDYWEESGNRRIPGMGQFPLVELWNALNGIEVEFEVPNLERALVGREAEAHIARNVEAMVTLNKLRVSHFSTQDD